MTAGPIIPDSWTFNANAQSYTISGADVNFSLAGATGGIIDNANAGQTITISNNIGESVAGVAVQALGNSTLVLTGTNTYTGGTTIAAGATLQLGNGGATGSVAGNIADNGLLKFNYSGSVTTAGTISGSGNAEVVAGTVIVTNTSVVGGTVTIDSGATLQWGNGTGGAFLIGPGNALVDNGSLVMNFGGASGVVGAVPISGTGSVTIQSGLFEELTASTYTGGTTVNAGAKLQLGNGGSTVGSVAGNIIDNGLVQFDYAGAPAVAAANTFTGSGNVEAVSGTTVITGTSAVAGTVTIDFGATMQWGAGGPAFLVGGGNAVVDNGALVMNFGPSGISGSLPISGTGSVTIQSGLWNETAASTYSGNTTINAGATLQLGNGSSTSGSVAGNIIDNGLLQFNYSGPVTVGNSISGSGAAEVVAGTVIVTNTSVVGGTVTIDSGATLQWGNGTGGAFLIGPGNALVDNGSLVMNFGGASGVVGAVPISGTGSVTIQSGLFEELTASTYTGGTTVNAGAKLQLGNGGSTVGSVAGNITDNGLVQFDYAGAGPVTAANTFTGSGNVEAVSGTTVITGTSAVAGTVTIDCGATMQWGDGGPLSWSAAATRWSTTARWS